MSDKAWGETQFRELIRGFLSKGQYPDHETLWKATGRRRHQRSGLSVEETQWRQNEVELAGYDWNASKKAKRLIRHA